MHLCIVFMAHYKYIDYHLKNALKTKRYLDMCLCYQVRVDCVCPQPEGDDRVS